MQDPDPDLSQSGSATILPITLSAIRCFSPHFCLIISTRDAPDIRPDNPAFFDIRYPAGYQIALPDIRPDFR
jgi:hypothetical protein